MSDTGNPTIDIRCVDCGMPLAEGPLMATPEGKKCQECFSKDPQNMVCDFCRADNPIWTFEGEEMIAGEVVELEPFVIAIPMIHLGGGWAACQACYEDVLTSRIDRLVQRVFEAMPPTQEELGGGDLVVVMTHFFRAVIENIHDPRRIE